MIWVNKITQVSVHNCTTHHLHIILCVHHPKSSLHLSTFIPSPFSTSLYPLLQQSSYCFPCPWFFLLPSFLPSFLFCPFCSIPATNPPSPSSARAVNQNVPTILKVPAAELLHVLVGRNQWDCKSDEVWILYIRDIKMCRNVPLSTDDIGHCRVRRLWSSRGSGHATSLCKYSHSRLCMHCLGCFGAAMAELSFSNRYQSACKA